MFAKSTNMNSWHYDLSLLPQYLEVFFAKLRIAVVFGGNCDRPDSVIYKTHNPRSWKSYETVAREIAQALTEIGFNHVYVIPDDMNLPQQLKQQNIHLVWLNTGGVQGYNPVCHTPALLEMLGMPYVGHNPLNSSTLDNKHAFKRELQSVGIKTAPFMTWHPSQGILQPNLHERFAIAFGEYLGPFVVKPVSGRASLHVHFVDKIEGLSQAVSEVHRATHNTALIEKYLPGREFCVAVCGYVTYAKGGFYKNPKPFAFSTVERVLESEERIFTSMDKKAITADRGRLMGAEEPELKQQLIELASKIYWEFSLNSLVRIDVRSDADGSLYVLEANPKPDLKHPGENVTSLVALGLAEYGMSYNDLIFSLLADRLDYLLTQHMGIIPHIVDLLR
ncbi:MAG: ATP-grasp domain-containing protein [Microcoleus sp. PH2017_10_PVI_O_A]|uniref:D-alanine--D-alanine ligase family protein n=2 Tax=unclassified Microcoleus TaxID=2642155 RepID=UPI001D81F90F|nr:MULTISPECIES: ATP-grasp domain-containing protein [unclassified Microcoleus]MCC3462321.1 ATP-grasp domain-containing protein [Microcoleus sp. PH2017_11_PCY_U_A]MCC3480772.1 ATP-grasp domain-containing protein [Microcoleus sp. PH2017_12_PCY_D_A]MCC3530698.1 ATP-grasp domain-containing protein [Microcoleus sp. PH2017_21_RUC_O_A]TAE79473.1 MAG: ATP-grasp domain-containing protein [Oscillatoriales cyanobacterium]MCC3408227.1 ATP-grasp domain-containing protein [Microcoleus sp. PH2017_10_PVI_O_A